MKKYKYILSFKIFYEGKYRARKITSFLFAEDIVDAQNKACEIWTLTLKSVDNQIIHADYYISGEWKI